MGKKQKNISVPEEYYAELEKLYEEYKDIFNMIEITSPAKLLRVLANLGRKSFLDFLEGKCSLSELFVEESTLRKKIEDIRGKQPKPS